MKIKGSSMQLKDYAPKWPQSLTAVALMIATLFARNLSAQAKNSAAESTNICLQTARDALASCTSAAQSNYQVALGKCINITDSTGQRSCEKQAAAVSYGRFNNCLKSQETTPLEPDALEDKYYAPELGTSSLWTW